MNYHLIAHSLFFCFFKKKATSPLFWRQILRLEIAAKSIIKIIMGFFMGVSCFLLVIFSAFLCASEIALFSLSKLQIRSFREKNRALHQKIKALLSDPSGLLFTLLALNEVMSVTLTAIITSSVVQSHLQPPQFLASLPQWQFEALIGSALSAPLILVFCELTPKVLGAKLNQEIASFATRPLWIIHQLMLPLRLRLQRLIYGRKALATTHNPVTEEPILKEQDFLRMLEEGHQQGAIQANELELIRNVFHLDNTVLTEIATPLKQAFCWPEELTLQEALAQMQHQRFSKIPIQNTARKEIIGIVYAKDLLRFRLEPEAAHQSVRQIMRPPLFVAASSQANSLFRKFKENKFHMAFLKNPQGETLGLITMHDLLECLFADLFADPKETP